MTILAEAPVRVVDRGAEYLGRARAVAKVVEAEANAIESEMTTTSTVYRALADAELFWILVSEE